MIIKADVNNTVQVAEVAECKINKNVSGIKLGVDAKLSLDNDMIYDSKAKNGVKDEKEFNTVSGIHTFMSFPNPLLYNVTENGCVLTFIPIELLDNFGENPNLPINEVRWIHIFNGSIYLDLEDNTFKKSEATDVMYNSRQHLLGGELVKYLLKLPNEEKRYAILRYVADKQEVPIFDDKEKLKAEQLAILTTALENKDPSGLSEALLELYKTYEHYELDSNAIMAIEWELDSRVETILNGYYFNASRAELAHKLSSPSNALAKALIFVKEPEKFLKGIQDIVYVLPKGFRPSVKYKGKNREDNITNIYQDIILMNNRLKLYLSNRSNPINVIAETYRRLYDSIGYLMCNKKPYITAQSDYKTIKERLASKEGLIRENMIGGRVDYSGRAVITVDKDMPIGCIGLPKKIAMGVLEYVMLNNMDPNLQKEVLSTWTINDIYKYMKENMEHCMVLIGRQPTLYYLGIQAKEIYIIEGTTMVLSPLDVTPYNADFDGDQMHIEAIVDFKKQDGQWHSEHVKPFLGNIQYIYPKDGKPIIEFRHEILYGLYIGALENYCDDYDERTEQSDKIEDLIKAICNNKLSPVHFYNGTTVEKYIIGELLDINKSDITAKNIASKISDWALDVYKKSGSEKYKYVINQLVKLGFGISKIFPPNISVMKNEDISKIWSGYDKLMSDTKSNIFKAQYSPFSKNFDQTLIKKSIDELNKVDTYIKGEINNDWKHIIESKARGKETNIQQSLLNKGSIGNCSENIKCNIVLSTYASGLSMYENFITANGGRADLIAKNISTAEPGYLARLMAYAAGDIEITQHDCGTVFFFEITRQKIIDTMSYINFEKYNKDDKVTCVSGQFSCEVNEFAKLPDDSYHHISEFIEEDGIYKITFENDYTLIYHKEDFVSLIGKPKQYIDISNKNSDQIKEEKKLLKDILIGRYVQKDDALLNVTESNVDELINDYFAGNKIELHSPLYCDDKCCRTCYGEDIRQMPLGKGTRVGLIAAQAAAEPSTQLVMKLFQSGGVEREGGLDSKFEDVLHILNGQKIKSYSENDKYQSALSDIDNYTEYAVLRILNIYRGEGKAVNIKHLEVILSALKRYLRLNGNPAVTYKNKDHKPSMPIFLSLANSAQLSANFFNRIGLENISESLAFSMLADNITEDSIIEKEAFGNI